MSVSAIFTTRVNVNTLQIPASNIQILMFVEIFLFEIRSRVRRPAVYLYFLGIFIFTLFAFSTGTLPLGEKEHINSPYLISFWCCAMTFIVGLVSSSVMGTAVFRGYRVPDQGYYLTCPITQAGYFWGRFAGSLSFCDRYRIQPHSAWHLAEFASWSGDRENGCRAI